MRKFQLLRYLKKWLFLIICFFVFMTVLAYKLLNARQEYTASAVIEYCNEKAKDGLAPDGSVIDVTEISSSANMAKAMSNLGLSSEVYNLDTFCAGISIQPIVEAQAESIQEAVNEEGEEYTVQPTSYIVSCTLDSSASGSLVRDVFNELLDVYFSDYSSKHINQEQVNNQTRNLVDTDYDYLEMIENIEAQLADTIESLHYRSGRPSDFRSSDTGYSFADLRDQFMILKDVNVYRLYSLVLGNRITKDKQLLIDKYQNRIANYNLDSEKAQEDTAAVLDIIRSYVNKMNQSGNTNIDYNYILPEVYGEDWQVNGSHVDRTVQYDELLRDWVSYQNAWDYARIDAAYCAYVIALYQDGNTSLEEASKLFDQSTPNLEAAEKNQPEQSEEEDETEDDTETVEEDETSEASNDLFTIAAVSGQQVTEEQVEEEIRTVVNRMNELYDLVERTNTEYNEYLGAENIRTLSSVSVTTAFNMRLYMIVIASFFLIVGCCGAVIVGRIGDILEYLFLKDRLTDCMNRLACDNYIRSWEKHTISPNMCCVNVQILNQQDLNAAYGREETDHILREFGAVLRELFENRKNGLVAYNGSAQFLTFFEKETGEAIGQEIERLAATLAQRVSEVTAVYRMGGVNAGEDSVFVIRTLISRAVKESEEYRTGEETGDRQREKVQEEVKETVIALHQEEEEGTDASWRWDQEELKDKEWSWEQEELKDKEWHWEQEETEEQEENSLTGIDRCGRRK